MGRQLVEIMCGQFNRSHGFLAKFIETCPDALWEKKFAGFFVWQHVYHCLYGHAFFTRQENSEPPVGLFDSSEERDIFLFKKEPKAPSRESIASYAKEVKQIADSYLSQITDADLSKKNEVLSSIIGRELSQLDILTMLSTHVMYHFGACDGVLRDNGLPGIY